jgi:hypothetical protein
MCRIGLLWVERPTQTVGGTVPDIHTIALTPSRRRLLTGLRDGQVTINSRHHYFEGRRVDNALAELARANWVLLQARRGAMRVPRGSLPLAAPGSPARQSR